MMKKAFAIVITVLTLAAVLAGCSEPTSSYLSLECVDEKVMTLTAETAEVDAQVLTGALVVGENESIVIEPAFEGDGAVHLRFIQADGTPPEDRDAAAEADVSGVAPILVEIGPGEYYVEATVTAEVTGTAEIRTQNNDGPEQWNTAASAGVAAWAVRALIRAAARSEAVAGR